MRGGGLCRGKGMRAAKRRSGFVRSARHGCALAYFCGLYARRIPRTGVSYDDLPVPLDGHRKTARQNGILRGGFSRKPRFGRDVLDRADHPGDSRIHWEEKSVQLLVCAEGCAALRISVDTDAVCGSWRMAVPGLDGSRSHGFDVCGSGDRCGGAGQASGAGKKCDDRRNHRHAAAYPDAGAA